MSQLADYALNRLTGLLPLAARQAALSPDLRKLHHGFLRSLVERGRPLTEAEIAVSVPGHDALTAVWILSSMDLIVLNRDGLPAGAYPVTTEKTPHEVRVNGNTIWAMCALDAVSVAPTFHTKTVVRSRCPVTGSEIAIEMSGSTILDVTPTADVQIGVWWRDPGAVAARNFCPGVMFLRDLAAARMWHAGRAADHDFAPLVDAVAVGERFFRPLVMEVPAVALA
jgi:mercuric reductase